VPASKRLPPWARYLAPSGRVWERAAGVGRVASGAPSRHAAVLSGLQERIARVVASLPESHGFALAEGAALVVAGVIDRSTRDLDFVGPSADDVHGLGLAVERALTAAGLQIRQQRETPTFVRFSIVDGADSTELDIAADARIRPPNRTARSDAVRGGIGSG